MRLNGPEGSIKGHVFDPHDPESLPRHVRVKAPEEIAKDVAALNERYRIVEKCKDCGGVLIAEETLAHKMNHVPGPLRALVRTLMAASPDDRKEIVGWMKKLEDK